MRTHKLQALVLSKDSSGASASFEDVRTSTCGIIFFGTPHRGSALGHWAQQIRGITSLAASTNPSILAALDSTIDDGQLNRLRIDFNKMLGELDQGKFSVYSFQETKPVAPVPHTLGMDLVCLLAPF